MDSHSVQFTAPVRSRSSQSPSPSHSASASATSSLRKRKRSATEEHALPPPAPSSLSDTRVTTTTSNDDLDSVSARNPNESDSEDAAVDDEDDYDQDSMRNFTSARLDNVGGGTRVTKLKTEVKVENEGVKEGGGSAVGTPNSVAGIVVKEDASKIFTENLQTSGAYNVREETLRREVIFYIAVKSLIDLNCLAYFRNISFC